MALNPNLSSRPLQMPPKTAKGKKREFAPVNARDFKEVPFIREVAPEVEDPREALLVAWEASPESLIIALLIEGKTVKDILKPLGWKADNKDWLSAYRSAQRLIKKRLCDEHLTEPVISKDENGKLVQDYVSICPSEFFQSYIDADGDEVVVDVAAKLKRATYNAMWNPESKDQKTGKRIPAGSLVFSIVKGLPFCFNVDDDGDPIRPMMWDIYEGWNKDKWMLCKMNMEKQFNAIFHPTKDISIPPGLREALKKRAERAELAAANEMSS